MIEPDAGTGIDDGTLKAAADSAEGVAAVRAVAAARPRGAAEGDGPVIGVDHLAAEMLSQEALSRLPTAAQLEAGLPGLLATEVARTAFFDRYLLDEVAAGVDQVVVLASGFDTRPYRFRGALRQITLYEVDRAPMLEVKARRVRSALAPVGNVRTVAADLASGFPGRQLEAAGLDPQRPTAVLCCGISMYLPAAAFDSIVDGVAGLPTGSSIALDYVFRRVVDGDDGFRGAAQVRTRLAAAGEVQVLGFDPGELSAAARAAGLRVALDLGPAEIADAHRRDTGDDVGEPLGYHCLALLRR